MTFRMRSIDHQEGWAGSVLDVYGKGVHGRDFDESLALNGFLTEILR